MFVPSSTSFQELRARNENFGKCWPGKLLTVSKLNSYSLLHCLQEQLSDEVETENKNDTAILIKNAKETSLILKKIEKDTKSKYSELENAISKNCSALKQDYEILLDQKKSNDSIPIDKSVENAIDECAKAKAALSRRAMETVLKNINKINQICSKGQDKCNRIKPSKIKNVDSRVSTHL